MIPRLHVVTDDTLLVDPSFVTRAEAVLEAGGPDLALHVRGPWSSGARIYEVARHLRATAAAHGAMLLVNDRVDVALCLALGAHLGHRSLPVSAARRLLGASAVLGVSVRGPEPGRWEGADFVIVGTVFPSASHPDRPTSGPSVIAQVVRATPSPVIAIGGIGAEQVPAVLSRGGHGVAVLTGIWDHRRPASAVERYLGELTGGTRGSETAPDLTSEPLE